MEANVSKPDALQDLLQMVIYRDTAKVVPKFIRENKVKFIVEGFTSP